MSNHEILSVKHLSQDIRFDDLVAANRNLRQTPAADMVRDAKDPNQDIIRFRGGKLSFIICEDVPYHKGGTDDDLYGDNVDTYGSWDLAASQVLANHMTAGKIVLQLIYEGSSVTSHTLTPGQVKAA